MSDSKNDTHIKKYADQFKNRAAHASKAVAQNITQNAKNKMSQYADPAINTVKNVNQNVKNITDTINKMRKAKGLAGKASVLGGKFAEKFKAYDIYRKIKDLIVRIQQIVSWISSHIYPIAYGTAAVIVTYTTVIFGISIAQSVSPTPHYYCDVDADASLKKTAVYQQYCGSGNNFALDNLNGHYIIQDGSGPCYCCAGANMLMRYFTLKDINFFDYLWDETGMYTPEGQTVQGDGFIAQMRRIITNNNIARTNLTDYHCNYSLSNGTKAFASKNGISNWGMANWGYLRDDSLDLEEWEQTSDYYKSNADSDKWVFDLSVGDVDDYSTWAYGGCSTVTIDDITCNIVGSKGGTGDTIKDIFNDPSCCGEAGVILYFDYTGDGKGDHAVLITGYDESTGYWNIIDSAKGLAGGYEGPMDGSGNFCWRAKEQGLVDLLNSGQNSYNGFGIASLHWCLAD